MTSDNKNHEEQDFEEELEKGKFFCLDEYEQVMQAVVPDKEFMDYLYGGADMGQGIERNRKAFEKLLLRPKACAGLKNRSLKTTFLGREIAYPIGFAATAGRAWLHKNGEQVCAKTAAELNLPFCMSVGSTVQMEKITKAVKEFDSTSIKLMTMSMIKDKKWMKEVIERTEKADFQAIVINLDHPVGGNTRGAAKGPLKSAVMKKIGAPNLPKDMYKEYVKDVNVNPKVFSDGCETWEDVEWVKNNTKLPIIVKGIARPLDAKMAVNIGVTAIWVSNHGGRQLGDAPATIDMLARIAPAIKGSGVELYVDGGFRTGADVLKALALGANCVFLGRPILSALAINGADGIKEMMVILQKELNISACLCGCSTMADINEKVLWKNV